MALRLRGHTWRECHRRSHIITGNRTETVSSVTRRRRRLYEPTMIHSLYRLTKTPTICDPQCSTTNQSSSLPIKHHRRDPRGCNECASVVEATDEMQVWPPRPIQGPGADNAYECRPRCAHTMGGDSRCGAAQLRAASRAPPASLPLKQVWVLGGQGKGPCCPQRQTVATSE